MSEQLLEAVARELNIPAADLDAIITFESGWNPKAHSAVGSGSGLLQFIDSTAQWLGYASADDLVAQNPTVEDQLRGPVFEYLKRYRPYPTRQALAMAVFWPAARYWDPHQQFTDPRIPAGNNGINSPAQYMEKVWPGEPVDVRYSGTPGKKLAIAGIVAAAFWAVMALRS